jgi:hypothetical protein
VKRALLFVSVFFFVTYASAQDHPYIFNIGGGPGFPVSSISDFANVGGHFVAGAGINTKRGFGLDGEFMWHDLPPKQSIINLTGAPDGAARMYSFTGNIIVHSPGEHKAGLYGIGGIGWYHRSWELTHPTLAIGTTCLPSYVWWGVVCTNGLVSTDAKLASGSSDAFGFNVGLGLTYRLGESPAKFYTELRYHRAYTSGIDTQVLPLTFGIRF